MWHVPSTAAHRMLLKMHYFKFQVPNSFAGSVAPWQMLIELSVHLSAVHVTWFDFIRYLGMLPDFIVV